MPAEVRLFTVLVVDDDPDILQSLGDLIETTIRGVRALKARSGAEALAQLDREDVDLIMTDLRMPGMNGLEFLEHAGSRAPGTPCIMITAYPDLDVVLAAVNVLRARAFLVKPIDPSELIALVEDALMSPHAEKHRRRAQLATVRGEA